MDAPVLDARRGATSPQADKYRDHGCAVVGLLSIQSGAVTDISGFSPLTHVCGTLAIQAQSLTTLDGLQNLRYVGGAAIINYGNAGKLRAAGGVGEELGGPGSSG